MSSADEYARRSTARKRFTEQSLADDASEHRDRLKTGSDKPAPTPKADFANLPNRVGRPDRASNR